MSGRQPFERLTERFSTTRRARVSARKAELRKAVRLEARETPADKGGDADALETPATLHGGQVDAGSTGNPSKSLRVHGKGRD